MPQPVSEYTSCEQDIIRSIGRAVSIRMDNIGNIHRSVVPEQDIVEYVTIMEWLSKHPISFLERVVRGSILSHHDRNWFIENVKYIQARRDEIGIDAVRKNMIDRHANTYYERTGKPLDHARMYKESGVGSTSSGDYPDDDMRVTEYETGEKSMTKTQINVRVDKALLEKARLLELNVSDICRMAIESRVKSIATGIPALKPKLDEIDAKYEKV